MPEHGGPGHAQANPGGRMGPIAGIHDPALEALLRAAAEAAGGDLPDGAPAAWAGAVAAGAVAAADAPLTPHERLRVCALRRALDPAAPLSDDALARLLRGLDAAAPAESAPLRGMDAVVEFAHDLRSPLTSILFLAGALRDGGGRLSGVQRRHVGIIYSAALGLVTLAGDMIEYFRAGAGDRAVDRAPFSVRELLDSIHELVLPIAEEKGVELRVSEVEADRRVGSPVAISRVLLNLVSNGLRYTEQGYVAVSAEAAGPDRVRFCVADTGPGLSDEARSALFAPYRRREGGGRYGFSGSGLGLGICRRLVSAMGGELTLDTAPGRGCRFSFELDLPPAEPG
jgi:signal transduction histidine kinase